MGKNEYDENILYIIYILVPHIKCGFWQACKCLVWLVIT